MQAAAALAIGMWLHCCCAQRWVLLPGGCLIVAQCSHAAVSLHAQPALLYCTAALLWLRL
jgi:hypothetical protein